MNTSDESTRAAWSRLYHARVSHALQRSGVEHLLIKGPTRGAIEGVAGVSGDVDVLLHRSCLPDAITALDSYGYRPDGTAAGEVATHSIGLIAPTGPGVDVHIDYPGCQLRPRDHWRALLAHRRTVDLAHFEVPSLDATGQLFITTLTAARDGGQSRAALRLRALSARTSTAGWWLVRNLAEEVDGLVALGVGLRRLGSSGEALASQLRLPSPGPRWRLHDEGASSVALRLQDLLDIRGTERLGFVAREFLPTRAFMRLAYPDLDRGDISLPRAHARRWLRLMREVPQAAAVVRSAHRRRRSGEPPTT